ncbi:MAG: aldolase catalytic domain-containing protein [Eubacterium sp.]|nr:aldolase catalytic domain-containing protein [Eubacterium sp.]
MPDVKLLDCTLRDGGYVNDWNFGHDNLVCIYERLVSANVDFIELGFIDERRLFDWNRSIAPDTKSFGRIFHGLEKRNSMLLGMIDFGTCGLEKIQPCRESIFDGIRVIFKKHVRKQAIDFCRKLQEAGYKVFVQLVSITSYDDEELSDLIHLANELHPYAVSMVDTYGLLQQENLIHYFTELNQKLCPDIALGYHSHNNFQRAFANCTEMLLQKTDRCLLVDATIYGMGKSAGNCPIELLAMYLNHNFQKNYDITQILEALDANIMRFYKYKPWGYSMFYYMSALNNCHPGYVADLMEKRTLSVKQMNELLGKLQNYGDKQLMYDKSLMEKIYIEYQKQIRVDDAKDIQKLAGDFAGKKVLLLGPGKSIEQQREYILEFINENNPFIVTVNYIPDLLPAHYIFLSNAKRYVQLATALLRKQNSIKVIATSNVTAMPDKNFDYSLDISSLLDEAAEIVDNSFLMLLKVMVKIGVHSVALAGFDGYIGEKEKDHMDKNMEYDFSKDQAERLNRYVGTVICDMGSKIEMNFITNTRYLTSGSDF